MRVSVVHAGIGFSRAFEPNLGIVAEDLGIDLGIPIVDLGIDLGIPLPKSNAVFKPI